MWKLMSKYTTSTWMEVSLQKICNFYFQQDQTWTNNDCFVIGKCNLNVE